MNPFHWHQTIKQHVLSLARPTAIALFTIAGTSQYAVAASLPLNFNGCTGPGSGPECTPEFAHGNLDVSYSIDGGSNTGTLSFSGSGTYSVTLADTLVDDGTSGTGDSDGKSGYSVQGFNLNGGFTSSPTKFEFDIIFDLNSVAADQALNALAGSDLDFNGIVSQNNAGSFTPDANVNLAPVQIVTRDNGGNVTGTNELLGDLLTADITDFAFTNYSGTGDAAIEFSFLGAVDQLLSEVAFATGDTLAQGIAPVVIASGDLDASKDWWEYEWVGSASANVVVPVPAAFWLLGSAMFGLLSFKRKTGNPLT